MVHRKSELDILVEKAIKLIMFAQPNLNRRQAYGFLQEVVEKKGNKFDLKAQGFTKKIHGVRVIKDD